MSVNTSTQSVTGMSSVQNNSSISTATITAGNVAAGLLWGNITASSPIITCNGGQASIHANGDVVIEGDLKVQDLDVVESFEKIQDRLEVIEERLVILNPNTQLESRWSDLRELRTQYQKLEQELIQGEALWRALKGDQKP